MNRPIPLNRAEAEALEAQFGLRALATAVNDSASASGEFRASALLEPESCAEYLDALAARLGTDSRPIAASMLAKRYAAVAAAPFFHALTCFDKALELPLESVLLRSGSHWLEGIAVNGPLNATPVDGSRESWRLRAAERFLRFHITPLWQSISSCSGLSAAILWENAAVRIYSLYEKKLPKQNPAYGAKIADDLRFLLRALPAEAFGQRRQPLARFYGGSGTGGADQTQGSGKSRVRLTCCLYYRVSREGDYCDACPKTARR